MNGNKNGAQLRAGYWSILVTPSRARVFRSNTDNFGCQFSISWSLINKYANGLPPDRVGFYGLAVFPVNAAHSRGFLCIVIVTWMFVPSPQVNRKLHEGRHQVCFAHIVQSLHFVGAQLMLVDCFIYSLCKTWAYEVLRSTNKFFHASAWAGKQALPDPGWCASGLGY